MLIISGDPPPGSGVRGILMYKRPEHYKDIVLRCPNHKNTSKDGRLQKRLQARLHWPILGAIFSFWSM